MTRKSFTPLPLAIALLSGLTGCGDDADPAPAGEVAASGPAGDVQGGAVSDAMLPLESVTSKAPTRGGNDDGDDAESSDGEGDSEATGSEPAE